MTRRLMLAAVTAAAVAGMFAAAPGAMAAPYIGGCQLSGTANFDTPLSGGPAASPFSYSFTGTLTNCKSTNSGPTGGTVSAGTNGVAHPSGSGSCASSTTSGVSVINWNDGHNTVISYSTTGATAAVVLQGTVVASVPAGTTTISTDEPATPVGSSAGGPLVFEASPQQCAPGGGGVSSAGIAGVVGIGSSS